jgi:SAM-dependent methyltransferase
MHYPREMLFGTGEEFEYLECGYCGCLQITEIPADLGKYYPSGYYSYSTPRQKNYPDWMVALRHRRSRAFLGQSDWFGRALGAMSKENEHFSWLRHAGGRLNWRILDVGCGSGKLILQMYRDGFHNIGGIDAFIDDDIDYGSGLRIVKSSLKDWTEEQDFLMLHHSFEHMPEPATVMSRLRGLVAPGGCVLIRIPLADSYARRRYGVHWFAWDAPRHLFLHTVKSIHVLAEQAGFCVSKVHYDSWRQQFEAEARIRRGLSTRPMTTAEFSMKETEAMRRMVTDLNALRDGDQAAFFLKPI